MSITISNHHRTLKRVTLRFGKYARHRRDFSPTNDQQRDLDGHADPCAFQKIFCRWTVNTMSYSLCFAILAQSEIRSSVSMYPVQSCYRYVLLYSFRDIPSLWPSHMPRSFGCSLTEWAQSIFPSRGRSNPDLDTHASTHLHWNTWNGVAIDAIKAAADDSDYAWSHSLRNKSPCFLIIATWTSWHDLVAILMLGNIHHTIYSMVWPHCQGRIRHVLWSGNLDHNLPNELVSRVILGTLFHSIPHVYQCFLLIQL